MAPYFNYFYIIYYLCDIIIIVLVLLNTILYNIDNALFLNYRPLSQIKIYKIFEKYIKKYNTFIDYI